MGPLTVTDLALSRGGLRLIEGLNFTVEPGQALILRGPNGVGKTTLLRALVGLSRPASGQISRPQDDFAYAGHADAIKPVLSVAENLTFWADIYGTRGITHALQAFALETLRDRRAAELSAGQKRRLGLARLLLTDRPVWALDEPTVGLDAANVMRFSKGIGAHLSSGGMAVIATHIDLKIDAQTLDLEDFRASPNAEFDADGFDGAFL